jgi:selenocysteine lyase/cysteine desulfurase
VGDLGVDFLAAGTHKWLFGPRGTGVLWGRREAWDRVDVAIPPFEPASFEAWINGTTPGAIPAGLRVSPGGYHSFEHRWALAEAFRFHLDIGRAAVVGRIAEQATQLKEGLAEVDGVTVVTPADPALSAGIVCAEVDGRDAFEVVTELREAGHGVSLAPYPTPYARFGPGIVTTPDEVDALVAAVADLRA